MAGRDETADVTCPIGADRGCCVLPVLHEVCFRVLAVCVCFPKACGAVVVTRTRRLEVEIGHAIGQRGGDFIARFFSECQHEEASYWSWN